MTWILNKKSIIQVLYNNEPNFSQIASLEPDLQNLQVSDKIWYVVRSLFSFHSIYIFITD